MPAHSRRGKSGAQLLGGADVELGGRGNHRHAADEAKVVPEPSNPCHLHARDTTNIGTWSLHIGDEEQAAPKYGPAGSTTSRDVTACNCACLSPLRALPACWLTPGDPSDEWQM